MGLFVFFFENFFVVIGVWVVEEIGFDGFDIEVFRGMDGGVIGVVFVEIVIGQVRILVFCGDQIDVVWRDWIVFQVEFFMISVIEFEINKGVFGVVFGVIFKIVCGVDFCDGFRKVWFVKVIDWVVFVGVGMVGEVLV